MNNRCHVDLTKTDEYEGMIIPDDHVEICLKVLRTLRNLALCPMDFNAHKALVFSEAHKLVFDMVQEVMKIEADEEANS